MTGGTHAQRIVALLAGGPSPDDDEIATALGIAPRQTVNQICRRLAVSGVLQRERGASGKIVNYIGAATAPANPAIAPRALRPEPPGEAGTQRHEGSWIPRELASTLLILPCSGTKRQGSDTAAGPAITGWLPPGLAAELTAARERVKACAPFDERTLIPAWQRYDGALYRAGREALAGLMTAGAHIVILSGGYGAVLAHEPIGWYEARLAPSWWPSRLIERVLMAYVQRHGIASVRAIVSTTGPYVAILKRVRWCEAGIKDALLLTPETGPGGMRRSPATQGQALAALHDGTLGPAWSSSYGLCLQARSF